MADAADIFFCVGEPSGDGYAAAVTTSLAQTHPEVRVAAAGCQRLSEVGCPIDVDMSGRAVIGFVPVILGLRDFAALLSRVEAAVRARRPKVVVTIDYPGFNLRLHKRLQDLRAQGTKLVHVVAPQVWAWRPRRAKKVAHLLDHLLCFFPFEPAFFNRYVPDMATFVGHPLVDLVNGDRDTFPKDHSLLPDRALLLAPGSRRREIESLLPLFNETARRVCTRMPKGHELQPVIAASPEHDESLYRQYSDYPLVKGSYRQLCYEAYQGIIASGTASLEAGLLGLPHVIAYQADRISVAIFRQLVRTKHIGLPNIIAAERVLPEIMQEQCNVTNLLDRSLKILKGDRRAYIEHSLANLSQRLGGRGAMARVATELVKML